jgi:hypothetical protein
MPLLRRCQQYQRTGHSVPATTERITRKRLARLYEAEK